MNQIQQRTVRAQISRRTATSRPPPKVKAAAIAASSPAAVINLIIVTPDGVIKKTVKAVNG
jgi:hypothetical protein